MEQTFSTHQMCCTAHQNMQQRNKRPAAQEAAGPGAGHSWLAWSPVGGHATKHNASASTSAVSGINCKDLRLAAAARSVVNRPGCGMLGPPADHTVGAS